MYYCFRLENQISFFHFIFNLKFGLVFDIVIRTFGQTNDGDLTILINLCVFEMFENVSFMLILLILLMICWICSIYKCSFTFDHMNLDFDLLLLVCTFVRSSFHTQKAAKIRIRFVIRIFLYIYCFSFEA